MAQIDGDAVFANGHPLDQKLDDAGLLRWIERRPELIELAQRRDNCLLIDGWALVSKGLDRSGRDLGRADHAPDFPDDGVLDHSGRQA
jgi:hypothetical protein